MSLVRMTHYPRMSRVRMTQNTWDYPGMFLLRMAQNTWDYPGMSLVRMTRILGTILGCPWEDDPENLGLSWDVPGRMALVRMTYTAWIPKLGLARNRIGIRTRVRNIL